MIGLIKRLAYWWYGWSPRKLFQRHLYWAHYFECETAFREGVEAGAAAQRRALGMGGSYTEGWVDGHRQGLATNRFRTAISEAEHVVHTRKQLD